MSKLNNPKGLLSLTQAAKALGIDQKTLQRARKRKPPLPTRPGKRGAVLVDLEETRRYLESQGLGRVGRQPAAVEALRGEQEDGGAAVEAPSSTESELSESEVKAIAALLDGLDGSVEKVLHLAKSVPGATVRKLSALGKARKDLADAEKQEIEVAKRRGAMLDAEDVERGRVQRVMLVKQGLLALPNKLAARIAGRTPEEVREEVAQEVDALLRQFAEDFERLG